METSRIPLKQINYNDNSYEIGRRVSDDRLLVSIRRHGMLRLPVVLGGSDGYAILEGFNRLRAAAELGWESAECLVAASPDPERFLAHALEKEYRRDIGPVGKVRLAGILEELFRTDPSRCRRICITGFAVPEQVLDDPKLRKFVMEMPAPLADYCDAKDINYRVMGKLRALPAGALTRLARWVSQDRMRVNLFRSIVDMLDDICRRDGDAGFLDGIDEAPAEGEVQDSHIHERVFEVRYPEYAGIKKKAERIVAEYSMPGISIEVPRNIEGPVLRIRLDLDSRDGLEGSLKKLRMLDEKFLAALMGLLG